jgi:hypothetical protein
MICYKDKTFCSFVSCADHETCPIFFTQEMFRDAMKWWGNDDPPICIMVDKPGCYKCATTP